MEPQQPTVSVDMMLAKIGQLTMELEWHKRTLQKVSELKKISETAYETLCADHAALKAGYEALVNKPG